MTSKPSGRRLNLLLASTSTDSDIEVIISEVRPDGAE